jgi:hypothetical protein
MKIQYLLATSGIALILTACAPTGSNTPWEQKCMKNYSVNTREYLECLDKVKMHKKFSQEAGTISVDPRATEYPGFEGESPEYDQDGGSKSGA